MRKAILAFLCLSILPALLFLVPVSAFTLSPAAREATDGNISTFSSPGEITVSSNGEKGLSSLYLMFDKPAGVFRVTSADGRSEEVNRHDYLHLYIDLVDLFASPQPSVTLSLGNAPLSEIRAFAEGEEIPDDVQIWSPPHEKADLLLFGAHSDDEHLFFGGIVPLYCGERGLRVQIVYFTNHWDTHNRSHELLNGLWVAGMRNYPLIGPFPDLYSESLDYAYTVYRWQGYGEEDFLAFEIETLRRFKPSVLVSHDVNGEYGHGTHRLLANTLLKAIELCGDPDAYPASAAEYGAWEPEKVYLHLWKERPVLLDLDAPLDAFGGKSAFEVAKEGYACHLSQQWTWFTRWVNVDSAASIRTYSPREYGLVMTRVGEDILKNDLMENIRTLDEVLAFEKANADETPPTLPPAVPAEEETGQVTDETPSFPGKAGEKKEGRPFPYLIVILCAETVMLIILLIGIGKWTKKRKLR